MMFVLSVKYLLMYDWTCLLIYRSSCLIDYDVSIAREVFINVRLELSAYLSILVLPQSLLVPEGCCKSAAPCSRERANCRCAPMLVTWDRRKAHYTVIGVTTRSVSSAPTVQFINIWLI